MLDIDFVRDNTDLIRSALKRRGSDFDLGELLKVDEMRRQLITKIERRRSDQNSTTNLIPAEQDLTRKKELIEEMKVLKAEIKDLESELEPIKELWQSLLMMLPNIPDPSVPAGESGARAAAAAGGERSDGGYGLGAA